MLREPPRAFRRSRSRSPLSLHLHLPPPRPRPLGLSLAFALPASPPPHLPASLPPQVDTVDTVSRAEYNDLAERHRKALGMIAGAKAEKAAALAKMSELEAEREEARLELVREQARSAAALAEGTPRPDWAKMQQLSSAALMAGLRMHQEADLLAAQQEAAAAQQKPPPPTRRSSTRDTVDGGGRKSSRGSPGGAGGGGEAALPLVAAPRPLESIRSSHERVAVVG